MIALILVVYLLFVLGVMYSARRLRLTLEEKERIRKEMVDFYHKQQLGE